MAQPQWPANSQASLQLFKTNLLSSAMQNAENVARKVVKMLPRPMRRKQRVSNPASKKMSLIQEKKSYLIGLCETRFVERHVLILVKHSKLRAKTLKFARKMFKMH